MSSCHRPASDPDLTGSFCASRTERQGELPGQVIPLGPNHPAHAGYVAFLSGDHQTTLAELQKTNQDDPFIQFLIGRTYEKLGDQEEAMRAASTTMHSPRGAYARPFATKKLTAR